MTVTQSFYLKILVFSGIIPFILGFHPRFKVYKEWPSFLKGVVLMMLIFIPWDIWFTRQKVWWFHPNATLGYRFLDLPIEEWLFFIVIPYCMAFVQIVLLQAHKLKNWITDRLNINWFYLVLSILFLTVSVLHHDRLYTFTSFLSAGLTLMACLIFFKNKLNRLFVIYLASLFPFLIVNGLLTGSFTDIAVVNYNSEHILNIRILNIPIEDSIYNLSMLYLSLFFVK